MSLLHDNVTQTMDLLRSIVPQISHLLNRDLDVATFRLQCEKLYHRLYYLKEILRVLKNGKLPFKIGNIEMTDVIKELIEVGYIPKVVALDKFLRNLATDVEILYNLYAWLLGNSHILKLRTPLKNFLDPVPNLSIDTFGLQMPSEDNNRLVQDFWTVYDSVTGPRKYFPLLSHIQKNTTEKNEPSGKKCLGRCRAIGGASNTSYAEPFVYLTAILRKETIAYVKLMLEETLRCALEHDEYIKQLDLLEAEMEKENISAQQEDIDMASVEEKLLRELNDIRSGGMDVTYLSTIAKAHGAELFHGERWERFITELRKKCCLHKKKKQSMSYFMVRVTLLNYTCDVLRSIISAIKCLLKQAENSTEEAEISPSSVTFAELRKNAFDAMERLKSTAPIDELKERKVLTKERMEELEHEWRDSVTNLLRFHTAFTNLLGRVLLDDKDLINQTFRDKFTQQKSRFVNMEDNLTCMLSAAEVGKTELLKKLRAFALSSGTTTVKQSQ